MTERGEAALSPRPDVYQLAGAAALTDERRAVFEDRLFALGQEFGLAVQQVVTEPAEDTTTVVANAETTALPNMLTKAELWQHASLHTDRPDFYTNGIWNALLRLIDNIALAKEEIPTRPQPSTQRAFLRTLTLTYAADRGSNGEEAINLASLYDTLAILLANGISRAPKMLSLGGGRLDLLASLVNERLQLKIPLPRKGETMKGMDPMPPPYPRAIDMQSPYLRKVPKVSAPGQNETIVSRDELGKFATDLGVPPSATKHFLAMFDAMTYYYNDLPSNTSLPRSSGWVDNDVFFLKVHLARGGDLYPVWGIRLGAFISKLHDLEQTPVMHGRLHYGLQVCKLTRRYLDTVAPYVPKLSSGR